MRPPERSISSDQLASMLARMQNTRTSRKNYYSSSSSSSSNSSSSGADGGVEAMAKVARRQTLRADPTGMQPSRRRMTKATQAVAFARLTAPWCRPARIIRAPRCPTGAYPWRSGGRRGGARGQMGSKVGGGQFKVVRGLRDLDPPGSARTRGSRPARRGLPVRGLRAGGSDRARRSPHRGGAGGAGTVVRPRAAV